ncbi:hypothetical protein [Oceanomicrobium pacificus]|uniref:Uncharacterized protein n=1 Tax=Oceanomicrobium pacificus TaxID=2692916 RepID=A0A6B0U0F6_9RHOB|nr:hypothetical protein [Oceanomicrobium pacificus]MXU66704.1 hypothetical protein [Oceanomicrobium pacificus]
MRDAPTWRQHLAGLDGPFMVEQSVKLAHDRIETDRCLVSYPRRAFYPGPRSTLSDILAALDAPPETAALLDLQTDAVQIHFGKDGAVRKCYLEFARDRAPEPDLIFLAMKWRAGAVRTDRYFGRAGWSRERQVALISDLTLDPSMSRAARTALALSADGDPDGQAILLDIRGQGNARRSVDISIVDAGLPVSALTDLLAPVWQGFGADWSAFSAENGDRQATHIAFGRAGDGAPFHTLYFGARQETRHG